LATRHSISCVAAILAADFGDWNHFNKQNPLNELLFIICSLQTDELKYTRTYSALKARFRSFKQLERASTWQLARILEPGGLAKQKARIVKAVLRAIRERFGSVTLAPIRRMTDSECEAFLTSLPGVGKKTARCVMLYSLRRAVFPVDTHCWRIARRLGWVRPTRPDESCSPRDMDRLQQQIPIELRHSLHVNLVSLGRSVCLPAKPRCDACPIGQFCRRVGVRS
jgi:endonuclease III